MMRGRAGFTVLVAVIILVTSTGNAFAQGPTPYQISSHSMFPQHAAGTPVAGRSSSAAVITPGQPGLSFRYVQTYGKVMEPYKADTQHLNRPDGIFIDGSGNVYVTEAWGKRVLGYDPSGKNILTLGMPGIGYEDDYKFNRPQDIAKDSKGYLWVADEYARVAQYDSSNGQLKQNVPADNPWASGTNLGRFNDVYGIAFDQVDPATHIQHMFVADQQNHRVQVFSLDEDHPTNAPNKITAVGLANNPLIFEDPTYITTDATGALYILNVVDQNSGESHIKKCTSSDGWANSSCTSFADSLTLNWDDGMAFDSSGNIYILESGIQSLAKCDSNGGSCDQSFISGLNGWDQDVAIDPQGNIYLTNWIDGVVRKYDSTGNFVSIFAGTLNQPYVTDGQHLFTPWGVTVGPDGSVYVNEENGYRLVKFDSSGTPKMTIGTGGVWGNGNLEFGSWWGSPRGNPAIDKMGRIYDADPENNRVEVFNADGSYFTRMGVTDEGGGDNDHFSDPGGIAISSVNGDIFITDRSNDRIQVFDSNRIYKTTIGETGVKGTDAAHLSWPAEVAVSNTGVVYIADTDNERIQKCQSTNGISYSCATLAGVVADGGDGSDFARFHPISLTVDNFGRVYVADEWNNRVLVYDANGAYLTSIGGAWGSGPSQFRHPTGVAVDQQGNVYIADALDMAIQKFSPGFPQWKQVNLNGFGDRNNDSVAAMYVFSGQLYIGAQNTTTGASIWRSPDGIQWTQVSTPGFGSQYVNNNPSIGGMAEFNHNLYVATLNGSQGGQIWRTPDGTQWSLVADRTLSGIKGVNRLTVFNGAIYAGTTGDGSSSGTEIWRSETGNLGDWHVEGSNGFGKGSDNSFIESFAILNNELYAGTQNPTTGAEVWRRDNTGTWIQVNQSGFGKNENNGGITILTTFNRYLYAGTGNCNDGGEIWRSSSGTDWTPVISGGFDNSNNCSIYPSTVHNGLLFASTFNHPWNNDYQGTGVWYSADGENWKQYTSGGFGDANNKIARLIEFQDRLYAGTWNPANGGEIWQNTGYQIYLPITKR